MKFSTCRFVPTFLVIAASLTPLFVGCSSTEKTAQQQGPNSSVDFGSQPQRIKVQHILIGFSGSVPGKSISRSQDEAETLANQIYQEAKSGANFDALVRKHTDDSHPGIYSMSNHGQSPFGKEMARNGMVPVFGDVGFALEIGQVGLGEYSPSGSKFGWHIIKRLE